MKYPTTNNYLSSNMFGSINQMAELDSVKVREMVQYKELDIDKIQFTPPI